MKCIGIIRDVDLGYDSKRYYKTIIKLGVKGIVVDNKGNIALFKKNNRSEYSLPGGEINEGENPRKSFKRKTKEETFCDVEIDYFMGYTEERRSQYNFKLISFVYLCHVEKCTNKKDSTGKVVWVKPDEALRLMKKSYNEVKESVYENLYHSKFIIARDIKIIEHYLKQI